MSDTFQIQPEKEIANYSKIVYTWLGKHKSLDDQGNPILYMSSELSDTHVQDELAVHSIRNDKDYYFVRQDVYGKLYDPLASKGRVGHSRPFKAVNKDTFGLYVNFLKTQNHKWLSHANKEIE